MEKTITKRKRRKPAMSKDNYGIFARERGKKSLEILRGDRIPGRPKLEDLNSEPCPICGQAKYKKDYTCGSIKCIKEYQQTKR